MDPRGKPGQMPDVSATAGCKTLLLTSRPQTYFPAPYPTTAGSSSQNLKSKSVLLPATNTFHHTRNPSANPISSAFKICLLSNHSPTPVASSDAGCMLSLSQIEDKKGQGRKVLEGPGACGQLTAFEKRGLFSRNFQVLM